MSTTLVPHHGYKLWNFRTKHQIQFKGLADRGLLQHSHLLLRRPGDLLHHWLPGPRAERRCGEGGGPGRGSGLHCLSGGGHPAARLARLGRSVLRDAADPGTGLPVRSDGDGDDGDSGQVPQPEAVQDLGGPVGGHFRLHRRSGLHHQCGYF